VLDTSLLAEKENVHTALQQKENKPLQAFAWKTNMEDNGHAMGMGGGIDAMF
jgi:hypothetical protein